MLISRINDDGQRVVGAQDGLHRIQVTRPSSRVKSILGLASAGAAPTILALTHDEYDDIFLLLILSKSV